MAKSLKKPGKKAVPAVRAAEDQAGDLYARFGPGPKGCMPKRPAGAWLSTWRDEIEKAVNQFCEQADNWDGPYYDRIEVSVFLREPKGEDSHNVYRRTIGAPGLQAIDLIDEIDRYLDKLSERIAQVVNVAVRRPELLGQLSGQAVDIE